MLRKLASRLSLIALVGLLGACAHPISLTPDLAKLPAPATAKISKTAGYYISNEDRGREVVTPGGGGDKLSYKPYAELEVGVYHALNQVFDGVVKLNAPSEAAEKKAALLIVPRIETTSYSESMLTWPPTLFSVTLNCTVTDPAGKAVTEVKGYGEGRATFSEFKSDFSLAAKRASEAALGDLMKQLAQTEALRQ